MEKYLNNINNFYGDVTKVQIQQGTVDSSQIQLNIADLDYTKVAEIINEIKKYDSIFDDEYGETANKMRSILSEIEELVIKKESPNRIMVLLNDIKNLSIGVAGSLIASGIVRLVSGV